MFFACTEEIDIIAPNHGPVLSGRVVRGVEGRGGECKSNTSETKPSLSQQEHLRESTLTDFAHVG